MSTVYDLDEELIDTPPDLEPTPLTANQAAQLLSKLLAFDEREEMMKRQTETLQRRLDRERKAWAEYAEPLLRDYYDRNPPTKGRVLHLPTGSIGLRKKAGGLRVTSKEAVLEWARVSAPHLVDVRIEETVKVAEVKAHHEKTGEVPDGCEIADDTDTFYTSAPR